jgi:hypothetical protein
MENLASVLYDELRWKEAEELQRRVVDARKKVYGPDHALVLGGTANLAVSILQQGRSDEAEMLLLYTLQRLKAILSPDYPDYPTR